MKFRDWDLFSVLQRICEIIWHFVLVWYFGTEKHKLPPIRNELLLEPAIHLAEKIRHRKVKSEDVVKAYIERIKVVNPVINAVTQERFQDALDEAREADNYVANSGKTPEELELEKPFLGIPVTTKNGIGIKGLIMDAGVYIKKGSKVDEDSTVIANMRKAGAIPMCVTNVPELLLWTDASCVPYGITKNIYDLTKHPGGSSGGEGAVLGAAGSVIGIGNDIYGSVRSPAYHSGIFSHKPTMRIVSNEGQWPSAHQNELDRYTVTGPMCRYAVDLMPTFKVIAGDGVSKLKLDQKVEFKDLKVFYCDDFPNGPYVSPMHPEVKTPIYMIRQHLEETYGTKVEKVSLPVPIHRFMHIWMSKFGATKTLSMERAISGDPNFSLPREFVKWCLRLSHHTIHALYFLAVSQYSSAKQPDVSDMNFKDYDKLEKFFNDTLGDNGIFLFPPAPRPAYYQQEQCFKFYNNGYTGIFNLLGFPVSQCAMGLNSEGMPMGVQVVSTLFNDHLTLAMAVELEKRFGGWKAP